MQSLSVLLALICLASVCTTVTASRTDIEQPVKEAAATLDRAGQQAQSLLSRIRAKVAGAPENPVLITVAVCAAVTCIVGARRPQPPLPLCPSSHQAPTHSSPSSQPAHAKPTQSRLQSRGTAAHEMSTGLRRKET